MKNAVYISGIIGKKYEKDYPKRILV